MDSAQKIYAKLDADERASTVRNVLAIILILGVVLALFVFAYKSRTGLNPSEYEGKVIDKWAGYSHSDEGSFPYFRLLIEKGDGQRLTVAVDQTVYDQARVGMWIKKTRNGLELTKLKLNDDTTGFSRVVLQLQPTTCELAS
jgi:hypothetical protein